VLERDCTDVNASRHDLPPEICTSSNETANKICEIVLAAVPEGELVTKLLRYILILLMAVSPALVANAATTPVPHAAQLHASKSRQAYVKKQSKQVKKMRKAQKKAQRELIKRHRTAP
jgi:hypothetical protein